MSTPVRSSSDGSPGAPAAALGLLLAAGAGRRMGEPKGLLRDADGTPWVARAAQALRDGGCAHVLVVVGAAAPQVAGLVPRWAQVVTATDWSTGMGASLRAGLTAATDPRSSDLRPRDPRPDLAVVTLVDLPGVDASVVARLLQDASSLGSAAPAGMSRAAYAGVPGHPVVLGREHWAGVMRSAHGDTGARSYLREREVRLVECGDIGHGDDVDTPASR